MERTGVIIVAGGSGSRAGGARPKQFRFLDGMPVLARTINTFAAALPGAEIVAVLPEQHIGFWKNLSARFDVAEHKIAAGGAERFHSVRNGLAALTSDPGLIAVQDGVRPLGSVAMIRRVAEAAAKHGAAIPVVEPVDSFRETDGEADAAGRAASHIVDRRLLRIVQTPQIFRAEVLRRAYERIPRGVHRRRFGGRGRRTGGLPGGGRARKPQTHDPRGFRHRRSVDRRTRRGRKRRRDYRCRARINTASITARSTGR